MNKVPKNVLYYGKTEPLPEQIPLRAGPLTMVYENGDLRYIKLGEHEVIRRLYVAIRDRNWNTAANVLRDVQMQIHEDSFSITYVCTNQLADIDYVWVGTLRGTAEGTITCTMDGEAQSTFQRNRIGFCLLHPNAIAGAAARITHVDGSVEDQVFPIHIAPQLVIDGTIKPVSPFEEMRGLAHEIKPGVWAEVTFTGDTFEMEDQRNWTDASYKSYGTPLRLPFPVTVETGTRIQQAVRIALLGDSVLTADDETNSAGADDVTITVGDEITPLPAIGLGMASHGEPLTATEIERLKALHLAHLRIDLQLARDNFVERLQQATVEAQTLGVGLEVALHVTDNAETELMTLASELLSLQPPVARWFIFHANEKTTTAAWVALARKHLASYDENISIGAGTNVYFTELNSRRPPAAVLDFVAYSLNPQVHAFDNASLVETLAAQATTVTSARQFCGDLPLAVSPVTLQPRFNPNATGPEPEPAPGELPPQVDPRQMSLFGAGWTLGSMKYLAETGEVASITYYETTGWRGVMERAEGSLLPAQFPSVPGGLFPLYHVLAAVGEFVGGEVIQCTSSAPLLVEGLVLAKEGRTLVLLANLVAEPQQVSLREITGIGKILQLDAESTAQTLQGPIVDRSVENVRSVSVTELHTLPPFGLIFLEI